MVRLPWLGAKMTKKYLSLAAANEFIQLAQPTGVSHMKLQKLVYLAHGYWLARHEDPFLVENPQVWQYGPVFEQLYHELKHFRSTNINQPQDLFDEPPFIDDPDVKTVILDVWKRFESKSAGQLSDLTHKAGSPWSKIAEKHRYKVPFGTVIPPTEIKEYFREQVKALA